MLKKIKNAYKVAGQYLGSAKIAPNRIQALALCLIAGAAIILVGANPSVIAANNTYTPYVIDFNDARLHVAINVLFIFLEGSFGALIMVAAGIGAIISSAFGQYRAALGLLVVAVGAFLLRALVGTFFNDSGIG